MDSQGSLVSNPSIIPIRILLVDDDSVALSIVSGQLRKYNHQVLTIKNPLDALSTLRVKHESFDLVFTDVHMPEMNGLQLQKIVLEEFRLPVVLMSVDKGKDTMLEGLENGASFYFVKPISPEHLDKLWQYTNPSKRDSLYPNPTRAPHPVSLDDLEMISESFGPNSKEKSYYKRKLVLEDDDERNQEKKRITCATSRRQKQPKMIWTTLLHNRFLEAISILGVDAVPRKILEFMNVQGLRRENVASHLQEANSPMQNGLPKGLNDKPLRSGFASSHLTYGQNNELALRFLPPAAAAVEGLIEQPRLTIGPANVQPISNAIIRPSVTDLYASKKGKYNVPKTNYAAGSNKRGTTSNVSNRNFCPRSNYVGLQIIANDDYGNGNGNVNLVLRGNTDYSSSSSFCGIQKVTTLQVSNYMEGVSKSLRDSQAMSGMHTFGNISSGHATDMSFA
ncbi:hypothetical protein Droror1_Dr00009561 [Drosera rotundifolia]